MAVVRPIPLVDLKGLPYSLQEWIRNVSFLLSPTLGGTGVAWSSLDFTGSNLTDLGTRNHNDLQNIQGGASNDYYHFTSAQKTDLTDGGDSTLHYHAADRDSANFTGTNWTDLTDAGDSSLHYHSADRNRANHTGTQTISTLSDLNVFKTISVSGQSDVVADSGTDTLTLAAGTNVTITTDATTDTITIAASGTGSGKLAQVVSASLTTVTTSATVIPFDDTIPQNTEGVEILTLAITPTNASSRLVISVNVPMAKTAADTVIAALFQDTTANALAANSATVAGANFQVIAGFEHIMTAGTTSATTFKIRVGPANAGTVTVNGASSARKLGGVMKTTISIMEVLP